MGCRYDFIIQQAGQVTVNYSHYGADVLDSTLLWGPDEALAYNSDLTVREHYSHLTNACWAEGGVFMDVDQRRLLWFGGSDALWGVPARRATLALQRKAWAGWEVDWAQNGVLTLADTLGLDPDDYYGRRIVEPDRAQFDQFSDTPEENELVWTVRDMSGTRCWLLKGDTDLWVPPPAADFARLQATPTPVTIDITRYCGGVHIDLTTREFVVWNTAPDERLVRDLPQLAWPGLTPIWAGDCFEEQFDRADSVSASMLPLETRCRKVLDNAVQQQNHIYRWCAENDCDPEWLAQVGPTSDSDPLVGLNARQRKVLLRLRAAMAGGLLR